MIEVVEKAKGIYAPFRRITEQHISADGRLFRVFVEGGRIPKLMSLLRKLH